MKNKNIVRDPNNYIKTPQVERLYGAGTKAGQKIRGSKTVTKSNSKNKVVTYSPINRVGKQTKTKVVTKNGKTRNKFGIYR